MKKRNVVLGVLLVAALVVASMFTYVVREDEVAVVKRLAKITSVVVNGGDQDIVESNLKEMNLSHVAVKEGKGLKFKIPFLNKVEKYTSKYLTYKSLEENINTKDDRQILIQMYAQYRIVDPALFNIAVKSTSNVHSIMDDRVYSAVINAVNSLKFEEFFEKEKINTLLEEQRERLNAILLSEYGIMAIDLGINRKNFPPENVTSIEGKMSKTIEKQSEKLIAEGDAEYQKRKAMVERQKAEIVAVAIENSAQIKADADAQALKIYQEALKKDVDFYRFMKRMDLYKELQNATIFMDSTESVFNQLDGQ